MPAIYLDHAATTPLDPRVKAAMEPYWDEIYANPSSLYRAGREAKKAIEGARITVAKLFHSNPSEIMFTGGGTEAINLVLFGVARAYRNVARHLITTTIEHHAVLHAFDALKEEGYEATFVGVDDDGTINTRNLQKAIRDDTVIVSVMYANNEIGTIEPIHNISSIIREVRNERKKKGIDMPIFFFTDACQAPGALELDVEKLGVDLLVINGSKMYGPKGVGCLYIKKGINIKPIIFGGGQERGLRSGTENVPGIVGFAKAFEIAQSERIKESERQRELRDYFIATALQRIPDAVLNGHKTARLPNNISISIPDIEGDALELYLDAKGIYVSTGSACSATSLEPSHVLIAIGREPRIALGTIRMTLGKSTTKEDLDITLDRLVASVQKLRTK